MSQEKTGKRTVQAKEGVNFRVPIQLLTLIRQAMAAMKEESRGKGLVEGVITESDVCAAGFVGFILADYETRLDWIGRARTYDLRKADPQPVLGTTLDAGEVAEDADADDQDGRKEKKRTRQRKKTG